MTAFWNGQTELNVDKIEVLNELSQEDMNKLSTGPQDRFLELLDRVNENVSFSGFQPLDITDKWNWRPGTFPKFQKYLIHRLKIDKKSPNLYKLMSRTKEAMLYSDYMMRLVNDLETERANLKRLGVSRNTEPEEFKARCTKFVESIQNQCNLVSQITEGKVELNTYFTKECFDDSHHNSSTPIFYIEFNINDIELEIHQGFGEDSLIQKLPTGSIRIVGTTSFRHFLNGNYTSIRYKGTYFTNEAEKYNFPFIARERFGTYGAVCFDKFLDDINDSFKKLDWVTMSMHILQWAQYYNINNANPYNQPNLMHRGMPKEYSKEYKLAFSQGIVVSECQKKVQNTWLKDNYNPLLSAGIITTDCDKISCIYKDNCALYRRACNVVRRLEDEEYVYMIESVIAVLYEHYDDEFDNYWSLQERIVDTWNIIWPNMEDYSNDTISKKWILESDIIFNKILYSMLACEIDDYQLPTVVQNELEYIGYWTVKEEVENVVLSEEEIKQQMLTWASNPERR